MMGDNGDSVEEMIAKFSKTVELDIAVTTEIAEAMRIAYNLGAMEGPIETKLDAMGIAIDKALKKIMVLFDKSRP
jgi:uncharacterized protein YqgV (UPF0045/DUF77 family)